MPRKLAMLALPLLLLVTAVPAAADEWTEYSDIGPTFLDYETTYPDLCRRHDLGLSVEGRHLWALRISDNVSIEEDEPEFKYIATMHGDEIVGTKMCMNLIEYLLTNYGSDPQSTNIIDEIDLWIVPLMNPDGYDRVNRTRYNADGVDLNRDFPNYGEDNTTDGRAIETAHIMNWSAQHTFTCSANFHGGTLVVNYPFDNDDTGSQYSPDDDLFIYISEEYSYYNSPMWNGYWYHGITNGADWYMIWGGMQDWNYHFMGNNEVTIEISDNKEPPASQIPAFWNDNRDSMLHYLETCLIGVRGLVTDAYTGLPLAATVTVLGRDHEIYTDPDVGDYHRMLLPGVYDLTFESEGYDPVTITGVTVYEGNATVLDVALNGPPAVVFPNGGEELPADVETDVTWIGEPSLQFHVQHTANYGDLDQVFDGFEDGSLGPDYTTGGNADWYVTSAESHSGSYSARAGNINDNQVSWMTRNVGGGDVSFWYRVSSESGWDYFNFYIDNDRKIHASGTSSGWTHYSTTLPAGDHDLRWEYTKDSSYSSGSDTVWIDDLQIVDDLTVWTDIIDLTPPGAMSTPWTPAEVSDACKVRVRAFYGGSSYGMWDESDDVFAVVDFAPCPADVNNDDVVDIDDLFQVLGAWGTCEDCPEDINDDGLVDIDDLFEVLGAWGPCP
ncbi:MAG: carboxypeptidase regulatory-like domain-containing protein [Phycisphaerales bacterium]|nr:MAG: carboxypeptidase regulatory-like domain-containing protein [Phycisphaerales bacterium]